MRQPHLGLVAALNNGLLQCRAPLIARMDADDVMHRERLAAQAAALASQNRALEMALLLDRFGVRTPGGAVPAHLGKVERLLDHNRDPERELSLKSGKTRDAWMREWLNALAMPTDQQLQ